MLRTLSFLLLLAAAGCKGWTIPQSDEGLVILPGTAHADTLVFAQDTIPVLKDTVHALARIIADTVSQEFSSTTPLPPAQRIDVKNTDPAALMQFAQTLKGVPYVYGSTNPKTGFDCSGFITYVFNHFGIAVPRSSREFTNVGTAITEQEAKSGDIVLFTGTNPLERQVGHMGLVLENSDSLRFIHSTSGKAMSVAVTALNDYYRSRLVKFIRIFPQN